MICDRCRQETISHTMSVFNTDEICLGCKQTEMNHPEYEEALVAEVDAIRHGDYNFPGVGLPADLES